MRRRSVLAALGAAAASALAGCDADDRGSAEVAETLTAAPVPSDRRTPAAASPADLSALGVADAAALGDAHWRTLSASPHGFTRTAVVRQDGDPIRRLRVTVRAAAGATVYRFTFEVDDTDRYPSSPVEPYVDLWDDGRTYQRYGREDPTYAVAAGRAFDAPSQRTTERYRVRRVFEAFSSATVEPTGTDSEVVLAGLRPGYDVTPRRLRLLDAPRASRLVAAVGGSPTSVEATHLTLQTTVSGTSVEVTEEVEYERLARPPDPPAWIERARAEEDET